MMNDVRLFMSHISRYRLQFEQFSTSRVIKNHEGAATDPANNGLAGDNSKEMRKGLLRLGHQVRESPAQGWRTPPARSPPGLV